MENEIFSTLPGGDGRRKEIILTHGSNNNESTFVGKALGLLLLLLKSGIVVGGTATAGLSISTQANLNISFVQWDGIMKFWLGFKTFSSS